MSTIHLNTFLYIWNICGLLSLSIFFLKITLERLHNTVSRWKSCGAHLHTWANSWHDVRRVFCLSTSQHGQFSYADFHTGSSSGSQSHLHHQLFICILWKRLTWEVKCLLAPFRFINYNIFKYKLLQNMQSCH